MRLAAVLAGLFLFALLGAGLLVFSGAPSEEAGSRSGDVHAAPLPARGEATPPAVRNAGTETLLLDLVEEVRGLRADLAGRGTPDVGAEAARVPVGPALDLTAIEERLDRIDERLRVAKDARRAEPLRIPEGRPGPLPSRTPDDPTGERFTRSHRFWSYQDVLDEYGDPNEVHVRDGLLWWYYNDPDRDVTFVFYDGLCTATYD